MNPKTTPKDFFLHLGATVALYAAAIALINLSFSAINYALPDQLAGYFSPSSIVWPVSMLIVLVPILYTIEWMVSRDISRMPEKAEIWIRRWRIYLTLFLAGAVIAGDLIALINTYLTGEITSRFVYKIMAVFLVSGAIFAYYILSRAALTPKTKAWKKSLAWFGIALVAAGLIGGFTIVGSPAKQRALRFDSQRTSDLSSIQWQVVNYWQQKGALPSALADLNDAISGFKVPTDPETDAPYDYSTSWKPYMSSNPSFELCATFGLASEDMSGRGAYVGLGGSMSYPSATDYLPGSDNWQHAPGHVCFTRSIDPSKYPPISPAQAKPI